MKKKKNISSQSKLSQKAEELIRKNLSAIKEMPSADIKKLIKELQIHQVELELQNEELRHAHLELEAERNKFSDLYEYAPVGYITIDDQSIIREANHTAASLLAIERKKLSGKQFASFIFKDDQDVFYSHRKKLAKVGSKQSYELRLLKKDGEFFWASLKSVMVKDSDDVLLHRIAVSDITERKRAVNEMYEFEKHSQALFNSIDEGFCIVEVIFDKNEKPVDYQYLETNSSFEKQSGIKDAKGKRMREIDPEHEEFWFETYGKIALTGKPVRFENYTEQLNKWFEVYAFRFGKPENRQVASLINDITERKQAVEKLQESESRISAILENTKDAIVYFDRNGHLVKFNEIYAKILKDIFGINVKVGMLVIDYLPQNQQKYWKKLSKLALSGKYFTEEKLLDLGNGVLKYYELSFNPIFLKGKITGFSEFIRDITERKRNEENMMKYQSVVSSTTDGIALLDKEYRYIIINDAYMRFSGINREKFIGMTVANYLGEDLFQRHIKPKLDSCLQGENVNYQEWFDYPVLGRRFVDVTYFPYRDAHNHIVGVVSNTRDITERKRIENELLESEEKYRHLFKNSEVGMFRTRLDGSEIIEVNEKFLNILNYIRDDVLGKPTVNMWVNKHDYEKVARMLIVEGHVTDFECNLFNKQGEVRTCVTSLRLYQNIGILEGSIRDITERKRAQEALKKSEVEFRTVWENSASGMRISDENGIVLRVNDSFCKMFEKTRKELEGKPLASIYAKEEAEHVMLTHNERFRSRTIQTHFERNLKIWNGKNIWVQAANSFLDLKEENLLLLSVFTDITEHKKAEEELRESEERYKELFERESDAIMVFDSETKRFEDVNNAALQLYGYNREEILRLTAVDISAEPEETVAMMNKIIKNNVKSIKKIERYNKKKDGTVFPVEISPGIFFIGGSRKVFSVVRDISERKKYETELKRSRRQFRLLSHRHQQKLEEERKRISRQVHDGLGQDLTALKIDIAHLKEQLTDNKMQIKNKLTYMLKRINSMIQIVKQISTDLRPGILDQLGLAAAIEWYTEDFQNRAGVKCQVNIKPSEIVLKETVATELYRILQEVLTNTARHSQAKNVNINLSMDSKSLRFTIRDNGIGFNLNQLDYHRSLGLLGMQERASAIKAKLVISNKAGKGTIVKVTLPAEYCKDG
jgi:PAS domain S-box-containing protein